MIHVTKTNDITNSRSNGKNQIFKRQGQILPLQQLCIGAEQDYRHIQTVNCCTCGQNLSFSIFRLVGPVEFYIPD